MLTLLATSILTFSSVIGGDHPSTPVYNEGWSSGLSALVNSKERVHGYFVNWQDVFFFEGDAKSFNAFLKSYSELPGGASKLVLHPGKLAVMSPWDKTPRDAKASWRLSTSTLSKPGQATVAETTLELWLEGSISRSAITLPKRMSIVEASSRSVRPSGL